MICWRSSFKSAYVELTNIWYLFSKLKLLNIAGFFMAAVSLRNIGAGRTYTGQVFLLAIVIKTDGVYAGKSKNLTPLVCHKAIRCFRAVRRA